jgi:hypothetical protein
MQQGGLDGLSAGGALFGTLGRQDSWQDFRARGHLAASCVVAITIALKPGGPSGGIVDMIADPNPGPARPPDHDRRVGLNFHHDGTHR